MKFLNLVVFICRAGITYPASWASLVALVVKNAPAPFRRRKETRFYSWVFRRLKETWFDPWVGKVP